MSDDFFIHTATVETLTGTDGYGAEHFAAPVTLAPTDDPATDNGCFVENVRRMVRGRDSTGRNKDGQEVISEASLYARIATAPLFTPGSRVTFNGEESRVIRAAVNDADDPDLDHVAVSLT